MNTTIKFEELVKLLNRAEVVCIGGDLLFVDSVQHEDEETYSIDGYTVAKKYNEEVKVLHGDTYCVNVFFGFGKTELVPTEVEVNFLTRMSHNNTTRETNPRNFKILSIIDGPIDDEDMEEIDRIRMDALEVFCGQAVDDDWYGGNYLYDGTVQIMTSPVMKDGYCSSSLSTNDWLDKNVGVFVENHSDLIGEFVVGVAENMHLITFIKRDLTEDQLNEVFIDFIEFLRGICPCEVIGSIERTGSSWK